jgi:hypothetical protein
MCPMRVFLILFSAMLAAYLAWRNYSKNEEQLSILRESEEQSEDSMTSADGSAPKQQILSKVSSGFWMLIDMASGRYLWRNVRSFESTPELKTR